MTYARMKEIVGFDATPALLERRHADINIFTVASGLLYEVCSIVIAVIAVEG